MRSCNMPIFVLSSHTNVLARRDNTHVLTYIHPALSPKKHEHTFAGSLV